MEKLTKTNRRIKIEFVRLASVASVGFSLLFVGNAFAQLAAPPAPAAPAAAEATAAGVDINLIPFPMIDRIEILKDGASAIYGADAIAGVGNFILVHKFRGLETGFSYGNTNLGASNDMGEWEAWLKAGTGDDKTDIVVIADFFERT